MVTTICVVILVLHLEYQASQDPANNIQGCCREGSLSKARVDRFGKDYSRTDTCFSVALLETFELAAKAKAITLKGDNYKDTLLPKDSFGELD